MSESLEWRKSSFSGQEQGQQCVEVATLPNGGRAIRDSKNPTGPTLNFTTSEWTAFIKGVRNGELD